MIRKSISLALGALVALALPSTVLAAEGDKAAKGAKGNRAARPGMVLKKYDANANGSIDGDEIAALRKTFDADKTGPLKALDKDSNGTLEDGEISAIKAGKGAGKAGEKKKKNQ